MIVFLFNKDCPTKTLQELCTHKFASSAKNFKLTSDEISPQDLWTLNSEHGNIEQGTMHHERYHVFRKMNCRRKVCHLHQSNMSKKQTLHRMHCITLAGTMNAKPTSNFELIVMQQRNHKGKKQVEQNLLNQKHCKNSTHTNLQVQQRTSN